VLPVCSQDLPEHVRSAPIEAGVRPECAYSSALNKRGSPNKPWTALNKPWTGINKPWTGINKP